ncbi:MAG: redoxin domain-containing protein [Deltaproteobacteria bacterium]|nr:redoxin domain-containing protein [Deltaproteobacteria bacterium]
MVQVGKPAPVFEAAAYLNGEITRVKLEDFRGKWVLLYFYPGDFTFV